MNFDLTITVKSEPVTALSHEQRLEVASWIDEHLSSFPEPVQHFLAPHLQYLAAGDDLRMHFDATFQTLRRVMGFTPSSERRRSGKPLGSLPKQRGETASNKRERLEQQRDHSLYLEDWHDDLREQHHVKAERLTEKLAKMKTEPPTPQEPNEATEQESDELSLEELINMPVEAFERTAEQKAASRAKGEAFVARLELGAGPDPALQSVNETLMPGGMVVIGEEVHDLSVTLPEEMAEATVLKSLNDRRVRYEISLAVKRVVLDIEKQVVVQDNGERTVVSASTSEFGPPRYSVTWSALATLAVLVGQFSLPFHRLATLLSTASKSFTAGGLSRLLHYVAKRLMPIYLELADQLADSEILAGDDTSCRVIEVSQYFKGSKARGSSQKEKKKPPWAVYRTKDASEESLARCEELRRLRQKRRADGDREAKRSPDEEPSLGMLIGRVLEFESQRLDGRGTKRSLNTTVLTGRSVAEDPKSLIVFYRSHLGGCGNLLESILHSRSPSAGDVILQADLSTTNPIQDPELLKRFDFKHTGCSAHARRPFALYEQEDPVYCPYMLHLFLGLAIHEERLDVHGRNRENVLAVRQEHSRKLWEEIRELAEQMTQKWSKTTKLGAGARYILKHYDKLTAYLDDPRLEPTNNLRERLLRTEKLIEKSSMFRRSLEGRFVLDIVRTVLQTAVAADVPVHEYIESVLRADADEVSNHPELYTPLAWSARQPSEQQA